MAAKTTNRWGGLLYLQAVAQNEAASPSIWTGIWNLEGIFVRENAENLLCFIPILQRFLVVFIPERRFVAGFFRRLLAYLTPHISHTYLTPHISHTYPAHHTYPTHIHSKRIHHTYPTHIQHIAHIPHISIPNVSHPYVSHQYVSMQCVSIQKVVIRIPPITTHIPYISSTSYISHTYPCNAYPFKRL